LRISGSKCGALNLQQPLVSVGRKTEADAEIELKQNTMKKPGKYGVWYAADKLTIAEWRGT